MLANSLWPTVFWPNCEEKEEFQHSQIPFDRISATLPALNLSNPACPLIPEAGFP